MLTNINAPDNTLQQRCQQTFMKMASRSRLHGFLKTVSVSLKQRDLLCLLMLILKTISQNRLFYHHSNSTWGINSAEIDIEEKRGKLVYMQSWTAAPVQGIA